VPHRESSPTLLVTWLGLAVVVGAAAGAAAAGFLALLDHATAARVAEPRLVLALPLVGLVVGAGYARWGVELRGGNDLVIGALHGGAPLPLRLAPMVLLGTVLTHLGGGSAGREGTAVQMGASLADAIGARLGLGADLRRVALVAGVAGGFGGVFGTPIAGAVFALELAVVGRLEHAALVPALTASLVADGVARALGATHVAFPAAPTLALTPLVAAEWAVFAAAMAAVAIVFVEALHALKRWTARRWPRLPLRLALGGACVAGLATLFDAHDYLGLGVPTIERAFHDPALPAYAFAAKLALTLITLGFGFVGGEVTPLFFIGATLGNTLAQLLGLPLALGAGVGMAAVFAAASNAPLALTWMVVELLGVGVLPHALVVAALAWWLTGLRGLYGAQRVTHAKSGALLDAPQMLDAVRERAWTREPGSPRA
jgi:H+/Cl- antiporter ClcA